MNRSKLGRLLLLLCAVIPARMSACRAEPASAVDGMVATVHPIATDAAVNAFRQGGNAVDAAVAAGLTLGVVDGRNSGIGGGCFILIRLADGRLVAIDGRETAPMAATVDVYLRDGKPQPELSRVGPLASGVPGALAAYAKALAEHGRMALPDLLLPAAEVAQRGFSVGPSHAALLKREAKTLMRFEGSRQTFLKPDGSTYQQGELFKQPDLALAYRAIAERGIDWFYRGPFARQVGRWMSENGGILSAEDFAGYRVRGREAVQSSYRGYTVVGFPPPSSGGVHVAQILGILERFDLEDLYRRRPALFYHVVAEAMKLAFADRAYWLGDPDFADVPRGLIDKGYAKELSDRIKLDEVLVVSSHGLPPGSDHDHFGKHTTHVATADRDGNWVAITQTVNTGLGSKVVVPGTGVVLNNEMDDFSIAPGVPNAFGLIGAEANAVAPGKRPLSSMSPTIVIKDGKPILTLGAAGGPKIITQVVMAIIYHLDLGLDLPDALAAPRIHQQWIPDRLLVESTLDATIVDALKQLGHNVERTRSVGVTQAISISPDGAALIGVHDPRVAGKAGGP